MGLLDVARQMYRQFGIHNVSVIVFFVLLHGRQWEFALGIGFGHLLITVKGLVPGM